MCYSKYCCIFVVDKVKHINDCIMEHLVIIAPKNSVLADTLTESCVYRPTCRTADYAYFTYIGEESPLCIVCQILYSFEFQEFSLDKETDYYRLKVYVE